jgi:hypothetical protein
VAALHVRLESATLRRTVSTARDLTGVGALPCVRAQVHYECAVHFRTMSTPRDLTGVRALPRVAAHMRLK